MARKTSPSRHADSAPQMGRTLKRFLGLIACGGLVAASVWINTQTNAQDPVSEPNPFERYNTGTTAGATPTKAAKSTDVNRRRVEDQMRRARLELRNGHSEEATRLASAADQMARQWKVAFKAGEQTPTALLALIQGPSSDVQFAQTKPKGDVQQASATDDPHAYVQALLTEAREEVRRGELDSAKEKIELASATEVEYGNFDIRPEHVLADLARKQVASPDGPSADFAATPKTPRASWAEAEAPAPGTAKPAAPQGDTELKEQSKELVALAREALEQGNLEEARTFAIEAQKLDVSYDLLDEHPEHVLAEIERRSKSVMITGKSRRVTPAANSDEGQATHDAALRLLGEAKQALQSGNLKEAKEKATQASQLDVAYTIYDDRPDLVLQEIRTAESRASVAATRKANTQPVATSEKKEQADQLIVQARQSLKSGNVKHAQQLVAQAEQLDVAYDKFDDRPEMVREDVERLVASQPNQTVASTESDLSLEDQKQAAISLIQEAQAALEAGDSELARSKAQAAAEYNVTYQLFEDTPEMVLAQIDQSTNAPGARSTGVMTADAGFDQSPVIAEGSALELYNQGVDALRQGDRRHAYDAFLAAYQSGEKLDGYRQQQLQDKLRELAPRNNKIELASGEQVVDGGNSNQLDAAVQQHEAKFDKLRTETLNAVFRAERQREQKPEEAQKLLQDQLAVIESSGFAPEQVEPLAASVRSSLSGVDSYMKQHAPVIELERRNAETRDLVEREIQTRVRVDQEMATLVDKFKELKDQRRFAEAHAVAKQALEMDPNNATAVQMELTGKFAMRDDQIRRLKSDKEESFYDTLNDVEQSLINPVANGDPVRMAKNWEQIKANRKPSPVDGTEHSAVEERVYASLKAPVSLHFDNTPLEEVLKHIADSQGIGISLDTQGLDEQGNTQSTPVTIGVDGIRLESALNLMLEQLGLDYIVENEVLMITSKSRRQGDMKPKVYPVADLIMPLTARQPQSATFQPMNSGGGGQFSVPGFGGMAQVPAEGGNSLLPTNSTMPGVDNQGGISNHDFRALSDLIMTTVDPDSWEDNGGLASISNHESTLSLVVRQTQRVHQEIADLLSQLRRLQDLQVTIEVRYISVSDKFFEQIGVDFDFNVNDSIGGPRTNSQFNPLSAFGAVDPVNGSAGGAGQTGAQAGGQQGGGQQGGQAAQAGAGNLGAVGPFSPGPRINVVGRDKWPSRTVVGMSAPGQFSGDLDVPFRQGSFDLAAPSFGNFDPGAGIQFGMAILSDVEAFLFVRAAQGDRRSNIMFAPKITTFNGIPASIFSGTNRPFVTSLTPVSSGFSIGFQPQITTIREGTSLSVQPVVSADRRYVRLSVSPDFSNVTDVQTFSFAGGSAGGLQGGQGGGQQGGGQQGGGQQGGGQQGGGQQGGGQQGGQNGGSGLAAAVQLPIVAQVTISTVVSVPDGGTVLLGGVKSLSEGRNMAGVPILNKIPYISRLFRNSGVGRETSSLMMMVTPRIIIQEEEEELLGLPE